MQPACVKRGGRFHPAQADFSVKWGMQSAARARKVEVTARPAVSLAPLAYV